jgi:leucine dehydrogenase
MTYKLGDRRDRTRRRRTAAIMMPPNGKTPELYRAMGRVIDALGGLYITAEDVGTGPRRPRRSSEVRPGT